MDYYRQTCFNSFSYSGLPPDEDLIKLSQIWARKYKKPFGAKLFNPYISAVSQVIHYAYKLCEDYPSEDHSAIVYSRELRDLISEVQQLFMISYVDKAPNTLTLICLHKAYKMLHREFNNNTQYIPAQGTDKEIFAEHRRIMTRYGIYQPKYLAHTKYNRHPRLILVTKHHKTDKNNQPLLKARYIAGANKSSFTPFAEAMTQFFKILTPFLNIHWDTLKIIANTEFSPPPIGFTLAMIFTIDWPDVWNGKDTH